MVATSYETERRARTGAADVIGGPAALLLLVLAAGVFFQEGVGALLTAWRLPEYSHGPLIPVLSGLLFLRHLKDEPVVRGPVSDRWIGVVVVLLSLAIGALGKLARISDIVAYAMIVFVAGVVLISFGWRRGWRFWPAILHLSFMLPLPGVVYWKVSTALQTFSSEFGVFIIRLMDIPVYLDGNIIDLGVYKLHVAEACSGLRYLFPIMSFSYVFATLYQGPVWHKAVLLASAAPLAVLMNSIRIGIIGVVVNYTGIEHAEGLTHLLEGWVIFLSCVLLLFGMARLMLALQSRRMTLAESLDLDFSGLGPQVARLRLVRPSAALLTALGAVLAAGTAWSVAPARDPGVVARTPLALIEPALGDWSLAGTQALEPRVERALGADDYVAATFVRRADGASAEVFVAWYQDQTRGGIHSPEICLPAGGWEMADIRRLDYGHVVGAPGTLPLNRAVIQKGEARMLVFYWFEQYGGRAASDFLAKIQLLKHGVRYGRTDGALVRLLTPIAPGESIAAAEARLVELLREVYRELPRHVPRA